MLNEAASLLGLAGLVAFAFWRRFADLRVFLLAFVASVAAMIPSHDRVYYFATAVPTLFAGRAVVLEAWLTRRM